MTGNERLSEILDEMIENYDSYPEDVQIKIDYECGIYAEKISEILEEYKRKKEGNHE